MKHINKLITIILFNSRPVMERKIILGTQIQRAAEAAEVASPELEELEDGKVDHQRCRVLVGRLLSQRKHHLLVVESLLQVVSSVSSTIMTIPFR